MGNFRMTTLAFQLIFQSSASKCINIFFESIIIRLHFTRIRLSLIDE